MTVVVVVVTVVEVEVVVMCGRGWCQVVVLAGGVSGRD
jgi:hypothetical protein